MIGTCKFMGIAPAVLVSTELGRVGGASFSGPGYVPIILTLLLYYPSSLFPLP